MADIAETPVETIPEREQIDEAHKWKIDDIFPDDEAWEKGFEETAALMEEASRHREQLDTSARAFLDTLLWAQEVQQHLSRVYTYAMLKHDQDTRRGESQALLARAQRLMSQAREAIAFIEPRVLAMPEEKIRGFFDEIDELKIYDHWLDELLRRKPHVLTDEMEALLAQMSEVAQAPTTVFTRLNNADLKFREITDDKGRSVEITHGNMIRHLQNPVRRVREDAYNSFTDAYTGMRNTIAAALDGAVKRNVFNARVRNYPSALEAALHREGVEPEVYHNLITAINDGLAPLHGYVDLRKRALGYEEGLHMYDMYVPLVADVELDIPYDRAADLVMEAVAPLGAEYGEALKTAFESRWIDVYENRGKRSGAYSMGFAHGVHPFVLMNFQPNLQDTLTLAHEMGHAMHSHFSSKHQPYIYRGYTIFVAEVASTVNEALLVRHLLNTLDDDRQKAYVLNHYIDGFRSTVYRQTQFAEFEQAIHEEVEKGGALTADNMSEIYTDITSRYYGPDFIVDKGIEIEWARIPHFHMNFYVYKYATGFCTAMALVDKILSEGQPAVDRYLDFLKGGSSDYPVQLLQKAGVDLTTPEPIKVALDQFNAMVGELESVL